MEVSGYSLDHLKKLVEGARAQSKLNVIKPAEQFYEQALSTPEAQMTTNYYQQRLITDLGMQVTTGETDVQELEASKRQYIERRRNRRNRNENQG